jgi:hypothetical protein
MHIITTREYGPNKYHIESDMSDSIPIISFLSYTPLPQSPINSFVRIIINEKQNISHSKQYLERIILFAMEMNEITFLCLITIIQHAIEHESHLFHIMK